MNDKYASYYIEYKDEFFAETGHEVLVEKLKKIIPLYNDINQKIIGLDVGSCIGDYIPNLKNICSENNSEIVLFEPNPINNVILEAKILNDPNIYLYKICVSDTESVSDFLNWKRFNENTGGNGNAGLRSGGEKIATVDVKRLDTILDERYKDIPIVIKFIKIDTEGNDTNIIKGLGKYLEKTEHIIFECSDCLDDERGPGIENPMKDIVDYLSNNGFDTYRIGTKKLIKVNDEFWHPIYDSLKFWSNCYAIKKNNLLIKKLIDEEFNYR